MSRRMFSIVTSQLLLTLASIFSSCSSEPSSGTSQARLDGYRQLLSLTDVRSAYYSEPQSPRPVPQVRGVLRNLGSETVLMVEFTLTFKNHLDRPIHTETAYPIYVSSFSTPANKPIGPSQQIQFAFKSPNCPPEWKPGHVDIKITKVLVQR